jgi:hypothetical protein
MDRMTCDDCFIKFGFPFWMWEEGGYVGITRVLWAGVVANLSIAVWAGIVLGWASSKLLSRKFRPTIDGA